MFLNAIDKEHFHKANTGILIGKDYFEPVNTFVAPQRKTKIDRLIYSYEGFSNTDCLTTCDKGTTEEY